jgi:threonine/homoserine/homoserine lactone efflux protein
LSRPAKGLLPLYSELARWLQYMFGTHNLTLFVLSGILLNLTPGQDTMYIVGRGLCQGRTAAVISALGISTGSIVHTVAAAVGLSAILATSATVFAIVKFIGAAYLIYLGIGILVSRTSRLAIPQQRHEARPWTVYRQAILTNVLNPKVALFFMAFLPQFVDPTTTHRVFAFLFLGGCFIFTGTLWCLVLAFASGSFNKIIASRSGIARLTEKLTGGLFVYLGARLAIRER